MSMPWEDGKGPMAPAVHLLGKGGNKKKFVSNGLSSARI